LPLSLTVTSFQIYKYFISGQANALRVAFRHVWDRLSEQYGEMADTSYEVLQLYALVEYAQLKSPSNGAAIWSEIFSKLNKCYSL